MSTLRRSSLAVPAYIIKGETRLHSLKSTHEFLSHPIQHHHEPSRSTVCYTISSSHTLPTLLITQNIGNDTTPQRPTHRPHHRLLTRRNRARPRPRAPPPLLPRLRHSPQHRHPQHPHLPRHHRHPTRSQLLSLDPIMPRNDPNPNPWPWP